MIAIRTTDTVATLSLLAASFVLTALAVTCASEEALAGDETPTQRVLASFPVHVTDRDEDPESRKRRLRTIADAIDAGASAPRDRAALLTLVRFESHAARYVHEGRCFDGPRGKLECDAGRATGHWQLHGVVPSDLESQARRAAELWRGGLQRCEGSSSDRMAGAFAAYATGGKCGFAGAEKRAAYLRSILGRLE